ncbi:MAG: hypothetical protein K9K79_01620 [Desulfohalobiaceae bacterium]|nr:hypothetical protein [Desulfohalobiaceae bacterium]
MVDLDSHTQATQKTAASGKTDFALLIRRLTNSVLSGQKLESQKRILRNQKLWSRLDSDQAREWSSLALMAGETDLCLDVLDSVNRRHPENVAAWKEHWSLLCDLDRRQEALAVRSRAEQTHPGLVGEMKMPDIAAPDTEKDPEAVDEPFVRQRKREELLELYLQLFKGREECFARQWSDKKEQKQGYVPVRHSLQKSDLEDHLKGRRTYGIYLLQEDSRVKLAVLDADLKKDFLKGRWKKEDKDLLRREKHYLLEQVVSVSREFQLDCLVEFSGGKGYHFWYFFDKPSPASRARQVLQKITARVAPDLSCFNLEVFPKQDRLAGKGLGNLVKLPLGIHRLTGKGSHFVPKKGRDVWEDMERLRKVRVSSLDEALPLVNEATEKQVLIHPRHQEWTRSYPELALLQQRCPALAQLFVTARQGKALSPREEKVLYGTIGFLTRASVLLHHLCANQPEYNQHLLEYKLSRLRGSVLGCKKIHTLLGLSIEPCRFDPVQGYHHPLLHCPQYHDASPKSEKVENLQQALDSLRQSLDIVHRFLPKPDHS